MANAFNYKDCEKIDGRMVNAYIDSYLDNENPVLLHIDSTWGENVVDLTDAVKAAETITHMELASNAIEYFGEDGHVDCIYGDDLSRIISMKYLKDVQQGDTLVDGDVYMYDGNKNLFVKFNLQGYMNDIGDTITNLNGIINNLRSRVTTLETKLTPPDNAPSDVKVAFGNINVYGDYTNANLKTSGVYTHDPTITIANDQYFA
jgi:hypothetical protein